MAEKYKVSRELGASKKEPKSEPKDNSEVKPLTEEAMDKVEVEGRLFSEIGFSGDLDKMAVVTSDIYDKIKSVEDTTGFDVRTLFILSDGSVQLLLRGED